MRSSQIGRQAAERIHGLQAGIATANLVGVFSLLVAADDGTDGRLRSLTLPSFAWSRKPVKNKLGNTIGSWSGPKSIPG
jgi:hypothetical protein